MSTSLASPGAGLPWIERLIGGFLLNRAIRRYDPSATNAALVAETRKVLALTENSPEAGRTRPVLIDRIRGIEDSSRNWSVYMTLDHLRIVTDGIAATLRSLGQGQQPSRALRIEDVKPSPEAGPDTIARLRDSVESFRHVVDAISAPRPDTTAPHPWFGPLGIAGWHILAAKHMQVHRHQLEAILEGLG